eukprot:TRINITY_DN11587_c0_g1_i5.p1 TRINITY_DN11587_c0_g1~~TRINITY_DN11587_c0_g1_i5.p1  ORF type:complete len:373 (-),score=67.24 TRINITY_DN11587_c0_g1_i5:86-1204(-)
MDVNDMEYCRERLALARRFAQTSDKGTDRSSIIAASKKLAAPNTEPLMVLQSTMNFLQVNLDSFVWPCDKPPLQLSADVIRQLDPFALCVLQTMLDREGTQSRNINALFYGGGLLGMPRGDPLHMDPNVCVRSRTTSGFSGIIPLLHVVMNCNRTGFGDEQNNGAIKATVSKVFLNGIIGPTSQEFLDLLPGFKTDWPELKDASPEVIFQKFQESIADTLAVYDQVKARKWFSFLVRFRGLTAKADMSDDALDDIRVDTLNDPSRNSPHPGLDRTWTTDQLITKVALDLKGTFGTKKMNKSASLVGLDCLEAKRIAQDKGITNLNLTSLILEIRELQLRCRVLLVFDFCALHEYVWFTFVLFDLMLALLRPS